MAKPLLLDGLPIHDCTAPVTVTVVEPTAGFDTWTS